MFSLSYTLAMSLADKPKLETEEHVRDMYVYALSGCNLALRKTPVHDLKSMRITGRIRIRVRFWDPYTDRTYG